MKRTVMCCLIGLVLLVSTVRSEAQTTSGTEKAVAALEEQWLQSQKTNNPDLLVPLLADKFVENIERRQSYGQSRVLNNTKVDQMEQC